MKAILALEGRKKQFYKNLRIKRRINEISKK
jgi:hypothetical protein